MGPYCRFCDQRCFIPMPAGTPIHIVETYRTAMGDIPIIASCPDGQRFEREKIGYCLDDIRATMAGE